MTCEMARKAIVAYDTKAIADSGISAIGVGREENGLDITALQELSTNIGCMNFVIAIVFP